MAFPKSSQARRVASPARASKRAAREIFPPAPHWPYGLTAVLEEQDWSFQPLLWQRARDVEVWSRTDPPERRDLFASPPPPWMMELEREVGDVPGLSSASRVLSALIRYPELAHVEDVAAACLTISEWADANHLPCTSLQFAEVAALAHPSSARAAAEAGQKCVVHAAIDRAEIWYERGIRIARRTEDWEWYIRSYLRMGVLRYEQANYRAARRCYARARSTAIWAGYLAFAGKAHHDMLLIEIARRNLRAGEMHARDALTLYPVHYERLPHLAHDYAVLLTSAGFHEESLRILDVTLQSITRPTERIAVLGTIARASAGCGDGTRHANAVADVLLLASMSEVNAAGALALASEGALLLGQWDRAAHLAQYAQRCAISRKEREPKRRADLVLAAAERQAPPAPRTESVSRATMETITLFLERLHHLFHGSSTDAGAASRARTELIAFTIANRA